MNRYFYDTWTENRLNRIISLLGKEWFEKKSILELGACYGDIGKQFIELGSHLSFSDIRPQFLNHLSNAYPGTNIYSIDQNQPYNLNQSFDLVLHLGVLYHIENWKEDIKNALNHTNMLILESIIYPFIKGPEEVCYWDENNTNPYISFHKRYKEIDEKSFTTYLDSLDVKYLRIDTPSMTTPFVHDFNQDYVKMLYGWDSSNFNFPLEYDQNGKNYFIQPRQMYLILK
jgi:2-polyprenyl-3-methyl-5-hydroxy-6-metoxy-1,4-benzoquinol methylase